MKRAKLVLVLILVATSFYLAGCVFGANSSVTNVTPNATTPAATSHAPPATVGSPPATMNPTTLLPETQFDIIRDIKYGEGDGKPFFLDRYVPREPIIFPMPAIIGIHGGGWSGGDKYPSDVKTLAQRGFLAISINYRLSGEAIFPAAVQDAKCAIRWLKAHSSECKVDPDRIGAWGSSAGGYLAMMVGTADESSGLEGQRGWGNVFSRVQAVCLYFGPSDFVDLVKGSPDSPTGGNVPKFLGGTYDDISHVYTFASPVTSVSTGDPPLLLVHGDMDDVVPYRQSEIMYQAYREDGVNVTLIQVEGAGHSFKLVSGKPVSPSVSEINRMTIDFFIRTLVES